MKRKMIFLLLLCLCALLVLACPAWADETAEHAEKALQFHRVSPRESGSPGVRFLYKVTPASVASLEEKYDVAYGAVVALGDKQTAETLRVEGSHETGFTAMGEGAKAVTVYATGGKAYATGLYHDDTKRSFGIAVYLGKDADSASCDTAFVSAAFLALTDKASGNTAFYYDVGMNDTFGTEESMLGQAVSTREIAAFLLGENSDQTLLGYALRENATVKKVFALTGDPMPTHLPVTLTDLSSGEIHLMKDAPYRYLLAAREAYVAEEYADYTTSIVGNYVESASKFHDRPLAVNLSWTAVKGTGVSYELWVSTDADFDLAQTEFYGCYDTSKEIYHLLTGTTYYWKVIATDTLGNSYTTPVSTFRTAEGVRWIFVEGVRNVRDIGGWTGLNQGLLYRGSELNKVGGHGLQITDAGIEEMVYGLGIKTDLDFRAKGLESDGAIVFSPLGAEIRRAQYAIGNFTSLYSSSFKPVFDVLADYANYPIYMHCWGGADRTGTVAFMLEGLCGVSEEDMAIDLEITSFSYFGNRYRYDNGNYRYASMVEVVKSYEGDTLADQFAAAAKDKIGLTEAHISNLRSIYLGTGAVFTGAHLQNVTLDSKKDVKVAFHMRASSSILSVTAGAGISLPFVFDSESATLTIDRDDIAKADFAASNVNITFDDGTVLRFYLEKENAEEEYITLTNGNYDYMMESDGEIGFTGDVTVEHASYLALRPDMVALLENRGKGALQMTLTTEDGSDVTLSYTDGFGKRQTVRVAADGETTMTLGLIGKYDIRFTFAETAGRVTFSGMHFKPYRYS